MTRHGRFLLFGIAACAMAAASTTLTGCTPHATATAGAAASSATQKPSSGPSSPAADTPSQPGTAPTTTTSQPPAGATAPPSGDGGCRSLKASNAVEMAVLDAYKRVAEPRLTHIAPKGVFYYGVCNGTAYAATRFSPTSGATQQELVALQDEGAATKYFDKPAGQGWGYVASDGAPRDPAGCAVIARIPSRLATAWADCLER